MEEKRYTKKTILLLLSFLLAFLPGFRIQAADGQRAAIANPTYTLKSTKDTAVSTKANPNETTVLIFGYVGCSKTRSTLTSIASCNWVKRSDIRVVFVETNGESQENVAAYEAGYQCPDITFCYREDDVHFRIMAAYTELFGIHGGSYPTIVLIDGDNHIQNLLQGTKTSNELLTEIQKFADIDDSGSTAPPSEDGFENIVYGLNSIDGAVVSTKATPNETTVLIFGYTTCGNTKATLQSIHQSSWVGRGDIRVIFADTYGAALDDTREFAQNYTGKGIIFCHDEAFMNYNLAMSYLNLIKETGGTFPYIVLIDKNNRVRSITLGPKTEDEIISEINKINTPQQPEHEWDTEYTVDIAPTCTTAGSKSIHCKTCDATKDSSAIPALGHKYRTTVSKATTKKNGRITKTCIACGHSAGSSVIYRPGKITLSATSYTYNGKQKKPKVTITDSKGKLISPTNYTVSYSKNKAVGTAAIKITWKGNYSGTSSKSFTIRPKGTSITKTAATAKRLTVKWKKQTTQASGYEVQYSTNKDFPKKTTIAKKTKKATSQTLAVKNLKGKNQKAIKKCYVRIRTYKTVNGKTYYSKWSGVKSILLKK